MSVDTRMSLFFDRCACPGDTRCYCLVVDGYACLFDTRAHCVASKQKVGGIPNITPSLSMISPSSAGFCVVFWIVGDTIN